MKILFLTTILTLFYFNKLHCQNIIRADEAINYVGKRRLVEGFEYYTEIRKNNNNSVSRLVYLSGIDQKSDFVIIIKYKNKLDLADDKIKFSKQKQDLAKVNSRKFFNLAVEGLIFMFKGKPAVQINEDELIILEQVD